MRPSIALILVTFAGCLDSAPDEVAPGTLEISPSELAVTITDGQPIVQDFSVTLTLGDGTQRDVTSEATFTLRNPAFGTWRGSALALSGAAVGPTSVTAHVGAATVSAPVVVNSRTSRFEPGVPRAMRAVFEQAKLDPTCGPSIAYPELGTIVPRNAGAFDVQWNDARDDMFEIQLRTRYRDVRLYTRGADQLGLAAAVSATDWQTVAGEHDAIELRVSGVIETNAERGCTTWHAVRVSDAPLLGALYLWSPEHGIARRDVSSTDDELTSATYDPAATTTLFKTTVIDIPTTCVGCALSNNGARLAVPSSELGFGMIYDFVDHMRLIPGDDVATRSWHGAAFTPDDSRLVVANAGELRLMTDRGAFLETLATSADTAASDPAFSPDGRWFANVESARDGVSSALIIRRFEPKTQKFGVRTATLIPAIAGVAIGFPTFSPDGNWLAFTRVTIGEGPGSELSLWIVPSDGSLAPMQLTQPTTELVIAQWAPVEQAVNGERFFYLAYATTGVIGLRPTGPQQIVVQPFFPDVLATGPAYRMPFQAPTISHQIAGWSKMMVR